MPAAVAMAAAAGARAAATAAVRTRHSNPNFAGRCQHTFPWCNTRDARRHRGCGRNWHTQRGANVWGHMHTTRIFVASRFEWCGRSLLFTVPKPILAPSILFVILINHLAPRLASPAIFSLGHVPIVVKSISNELLVLALPRFA